MKEIQIRRIEPSEVPHVARLWRRARESAMPELEARVARTADEDLGFFEAVIMREREVWVADRDGWAIGFLALESNSLENLFVEPAEQNQGVGRQLLDFAKRQRPNGFELFTFASNTAARRFYERAGLRATRFGTSPPPENEPDVQYTWPP